MKRLSTPAAIGRLTRTDHRNLRKAARQDTEIAHGAGIVLSKLAGQDRQRPVYGEIQILFFPIMFE
jgi:hypothetical protein